MNAMGRHSWGLMCVVVFSTFGYGTAHADLRALQATDESTSYQLDDVSSPPRFLSTGPAARADTGVVDGSGVPVLYPFHLEVTVGPETPMILGTGLSGADVLDEDMWIEDGLGGRLLTGEVLPGSWVTAFNPSDTFDNGGLQIGGTIQVTAVDDASFPGISIAPGDWLTFRWDFFDFSLPLPSSFPPLPGEQVFDEDWSAHSNVVTFWVPEPASLVLLAMGTLLVARRRR